MRHTALFLAALSLAAAPLAAQEVTVREAMHLVQIARPVSAFQRADYAAWFEEIRGQCLAAAAGCDTTLTVADLVVLEVRDGDIPRARAFTLTYQGTHWMVFTPAVARDRLAVEHEMLHALLNVPGHPPIFARLHLTRDDIP